MQYEEFKSHILRTIKEQLGEDADVSIHPVLKNNDLSLDGLMILFPGENVSPTIYLNDYYGQFLSGRDLSAIVSEILSIYRRFRCPEPVDVSIYENFDNIRRELCFRLINRSSNEEFLKTVPHIPYMDLAVIFYIEVNNSLFGCSTMTIHNEQLEQWNVSAELLYYEAYINTRQKISCCIYPLSEMLEELMDKEHHAEVRPVYEDNDVLHVLTTDRRVFGSSFLMYKDILADFSGRIEDDFYILPSSIHELIFLAAKTSPPVRELQDMVREINKNVVARDEYLSDNVYLYRAGTHQVEMMTY